MQSFAPAASSTAGHPEVSRNSGASQEAIEFPDESSRLSLPAAVKYGIPFADVSSIATAIGPSWKKGSSK